jgi:hypothetical protein
VRRVLPLLVALVLGGCFGADPEDANRALLDDLPIFPGAIKVAEQRAIALDADGNPLGVGETLEYEFQAPLRTAPETVASFYLARARGWRLVERLDEKTLTGFALILKFCHGADALTVDTENLESTLRFKVIVHGGGCPPQ